MRAVENTTDKPTHTVGGLPILFHALDGLSRPIIAIQGSREIPHVCVPEDGWYDRADYSPLHDWTTYVRR